MVENILNKRNIGQLAEQSALQFLQKKGWKLLEQNYYCHYGEIDLIMHDQADVVFIEVRYRSRIDYGCAAETVNKSKQKKLIKSAKHFLQKKQWLHKVHSRFDIIAVQGIAQQWQLDWIKNAFLAEDSSQTKHYF